MFNNHSNYYFNNLSLSEISEITIIDAGEYEITAFFDTGKCVYYSFDDNYKMSKKLTIGKATLKISISPVTRVYGDLIINNDPAIKVNGIEDLNKDLYEFGIYMDRQQGNPVTLHYLIDARTYYLTLAITEDKIINNYDLDESCEYVRHNGKLLFVKEYTINKKEIPTFTFIQDGVLREDGNTIFNDKLSAVFDATMFVDGVVPEFSLIFFKDGERYYNDIQFAGTYQVTVQFANSNYFTNKIVEFVVYGPQNFNNLIIVVGVIALLLVGGLIVVFAIRANRKKNKEKFKCYWICKSIK